MDLSKDKQREPHTRALSSARCQLASRAARCILAGWLFFQFSTPPRHHHRRIPLPWSPVDKESRFCPAPRERDPRGPRVGSGQKNPLAHAPVPRSRPRLAAGPVPPEEQPGADFGVRTDWSKPGPEGIQ